jgi:methylornithine synthase
MRSLEFIFEKTYNRQALNDSELACLLKTPPGRPLERLFSAARAQRERIFGDQIFLYGFVYFSTYCQNHCHFCLYRQSNHSAPRYRKSIKATIDSARAIEDEGVHLVDLTMGEDPFYLTQNGERLLELVRRIRKAVALPVMISPGVLKPRILIEMARQGIDWYACYQETFNERRFARLREAQSFNGRLAAKVQARRSGLLIEEGVLLGIGESCDDLLTALKNMANLKASQVRAMTFRPQRGTPMAACRVSDPLDELRTIAILRLYFPDRLIPASLDVDGLNGLRGRLNAGANVITSVIPPLHNLSGVASADLDIEDGRRTVSAVSQLVEALDLKIAPPSTYRQWLRKEKWKMSRQNPLDSKPIQPG